MYLILRNLEFQKLINNKFVHDWWSYHNRIGLSRVNVWKVLEEFGHNTYVLCPFLVRVINREETFYVLSPVPHLGADVDWTRAAKPYRDAIMQFLEDNYLPDLQANIVAEHHIDPLHFRDTLNSYLGSAFSVQPVLTQSAWFRPHNRSEDLENLYLVGAGTHPGAGLPGVLSSSKIAEDLVTG